jgi:hypothetical protein
MQTTDCNSQENAEEIALAEKIYICLRANLLRTSDAYRQEVTDDIKECKFWEASHPVTKEAFVRMAKRFLKF